jgi:hypothetical protein
MISATKMHLGAGSAKIALTACVVATTIATVPAHAQSSKARTMIEASEANLDTLIAKFPALKDVANVVSNDCASKLPNNAKVDGFCRCGTAVTVSAWLAGGDGGKMKEKLAAYINSPSKAGAADFVNFQGPELYKPVCELALGIH